MGQLIALWVFGALGWIHLVNDSINQHLFVGNKCLFHDCSYNGILSWLIPLILVFYTIGWINHRKNSK